MGAQIDATEVAMNLEKVLDKVNEVKFFSDKLHEVHNPFGLGNPNAFRYYFSAFLNAVYSVEQFAKTEVMGNLKKQGKKKFERKQGWQEHKTGWYANLLPAEEELWRSLTEDGGIRGREVHQERTRTTATDKAVPLRHFYNDSWGSQAYRAFHVMQQSWNFPGVDLSQLNKDLELPPGTNVWSYTQEHYAEIEGKSRPIPEVSKEIVDLCDRFVKHLESVPIAVSA
jgi:hypothetical protein